MLSWDNVYLLCWFDANGRSYSTSWDGDLPLIHVVVTGWRGSPPMWAAPVHEAKLVEFPEGSNSWSLDRVEYATSHGGNYAFGWRVHHVDRVNNRVQVHPPPATSVWDRLLEDT